MAKERKNYSALDDEDLTPFIISGEMPLFSLQMRFVGEANLIKSAFEDYSSPYNIAGGPRRMTIEIMQQRGLEKIDKLREKGLFPTEVIVTHDARGRIRVKPQYKR